MEKNSSYNLEDYKFLKNQLEEFLNWNRYEFCWPHVWFEPDKNLFPLYFFANINKKGHKGWFKKHAFAFYWLFFMFHYDKEETDKFLTWLSKNNSEIYDKLLRSEEREKLILRYNKNVKHYFDLFLLNPTNAYNQILEIYNDPIEQIYKLLLKGLSPQEVEIVCSNLIKFGPKMTRHFDLIWRQFHREAKIRQRIFKFIKNQMQNKNDWLKIRDLQIWLKIKKEQLENHLESLSFNKIIIWNHAQNFIRLNYNLKDKREFVWLAESGWTTSPFEPYLEKGKKYKVKDFRKTIIEQWMKKGIISLIT